MNGDGDGGGVFERDREVIGGVRDFEGGLDGKLFFASM